MLRPAHPIDLDEMARIHALGFEACWTRDDISELLRAPGAFAFVATRDHVLDGFVLARVMAGEAEILTIAVDPARRRGGVGLALVKAAAAEARALGARALFLEAAVDNLAALALYERAGFERAGFRRAYYRRPDGMADAFVLRRDLTVSA